MSKERVFYFILFCCSFLLIKNWLTFDTNYTFLMHTSVGQSLMFPISPPTLWFLKAGRLSWVLKALSLCVCLTRDWQTFAREKREVKKLELFTLKNRKQKCRRARMKHQSFLHHHQPRMNSPECRQPAGFNVNSHSTCAQCAFVRIQTAIVSVGAEKVFSKKKNKKNSRFGNRRLNFQLVTVDHQANCQKKNTVEDCCALFFFCYSQTTLRQS